LRKKRFILTGGLAHSKHLRVCERLWERRAVSSGRNNLGDAWRREPSAGSYENEEQKCKSAETLSS
jgi:hypothetical protein